MAEYDDEGAPSNGKRELLLYDVPVTLPLIAGAAAVVGGLALSIGGSHRVVGLDVAYFLAIALVLGGVVAYLVVGMWLLPGVDGRRRARPILGEPGAPVLSGGGRPCWPAPT